ncbi:MAG: hypothetical protein KDB53_20560, partial [Planctomycetes bacterium]|nr:hypothetical protein [Planctomycetota bacterium]
MTDDYLWDRGGEPDPEVQELEDLLRPLRGKGHREPTAPVRRLWPRWIAAAVAASLLIGLGLHFFGDDEPGQPTPRTSVGAGYLVEGLAGRSSVRPGETITVPKKGARSGTRLLIGDLGRVELDPGSRLRVLDDDHELPSLFLAHGRAQAVIGPEGAERFRLGSPAGLSVDMGCAY